MSQGLEGRAMDSHPRPSVRRAVVFSLMQRYAAFVLQLLVSVVLARLLTPAETGIFALAAAAVALGHLVRDFGVSDYIVSRRELAPAQLRAAFTATLLIAWTMAGLLWAVSWPLSALYKEPGVRLTMHLLCLSFALLPFGTVSFALLARDMQFGRIAALQTASAVVGAATTLLSAWQGASYLSMAWGAVAANASVIVLLMLVNRGAIVMKPTRIGLREVMGFGGTLTTARVIDQMASRSSDFIVSGVLGFHSGGIYGKALTLSGSFHEFFNSAFVRVATAAFARANSADRTALRDAYVRATVVVSAFLWVFFPILAVFAEEIVLVLFGASWLECVPVVQIVAIGSLFHAPFLMAGSVLTALGAVGEQLRINVVCAPLTVLALLAGTPFGLPTVAVLVILVGFVRLALVNRVMKARADIGGWFVARHLGASGLIGVAAVAVALAVRYAALAAGWPPLVTLTMGPVLTCAAAVAAAWAMRHPLWNEVLMLLSRFRAKP